MGLILPIFFLALLASISPVTLVVFILLLATTRARLNAGAFLVGWAVSLTVVFSLSYLLGTYRGLTTGSGGTALAAFEVLVGGGLVATGVWQWRRRNNARSSIGVSKDFAEREVSSGHSSGGLRVGWTAPMRRAKRRGERHDHASRKGRAPDIYRADGARVGGPG